MDCRELPTRRDAWCLAGIIAAFLLLRGPVLWRAPGGMDEDWFAIPGWTVAQADWPRVPYAPGRNPESVFYYADVSLFALPPAFFYWQAPLHKLLPPGYGTSRLTSAIAGLVAVIIVYHLGCRCSGDARSGLVAAGVYSLSRVFYFPAITARPDMLCTMFGLGAVASLCRWQGEPTGRRWLVITGLLLGLAGLTHPFALVVCLQAALVVALWTPGWRTRLTSLTILVTATLLPLLLWLPQIVAQPHLFRHQFFGNVVDRSSGGLLSRMVWPWESLTYHSRLVWEHAGLVPCLLMAGGLLGATLIDVRRGSPRARMLLVLAWSSIYLLPVCAGPHPTKGYWSYPGALLSLCLARTLVVTGDLITANFGRPRLVTLAAGLLLGLALLPGSGLRTTLAHLRHWDDANYDRHRFVEEMLAELPAEARIHRRSGVCVRLVSLGTAHSSRGRRRHLLPVQRSRLGLPDRQSLRARQQSAAATRG